MSSFDADLYPVRVLRAYESLQAQFVALGVVPPSMEAVIEAARRHPTLDALGVIADTRVKLRMTVNPWGAGTPGQGPDG